MEKDVGKCVGRFHKWYYDTNLKQCKTFTFGGCEGNGNRFSSESECQAVCLLQDEPTLRLAPNSGFIFEHLAQDPRFDNVTRPPGCSRGPSGFLPVSIEGMSFL